MPVSQTDPTVSGLSPIRSRRSEKIWLPAYQDVDGNPITNYANLPLIQPVYAEYSINVWEFTVFKVGYDDAQNKTEHNAINSIAWRSYAAFQAWVSEIHTEGADTIGGETGEMVRYVIRLINRPGGWKLQHPSISWNYRDGDELHRFEDSKCNPYIGKHTLSGGDGGFGQTLLVKQEKVHPEINFASTLGF